MKENRILSYQTKKNKNYKSLEFVSHKTILYNWKTQIIPQSSSFRFLNESSQIICEKIKEIEKNKQNKKFIMLFNKYNLEFNKTGMFLYDFDFPNLKIEIISIYDKYVEDCDKLNIHSTQ